MNKIISKKIVKKLIEPHFHENLTSEIYEIKNIKANRLLNYARFDLAFKLFYLDMKDKHLELARKIYAEHIRAFSLGKFIEPGNEEKNSLNKFLDVFDALLQDIKDKGFDSNKTVIPLSNENIPLDGAHRISTAIYLNKEVNCISIDRKSDIYDYNFFYNRNVPIEILDNIAIKFIEYANNIHIAFLWPTSKGNYEDIKDIIPNIVYKKKIKLNYNGAHNILSQIYYGEKWLGNIENNFKGVHTKLIECFKTFDSFDVIVFQAESLDKVLEMKEKIRKIFNVGKHSIHITDTKEEAIRIAKIIFNDNSIHFLNYAKPNKYISTHKKINSLKKQMKDKNINIEDVILINDIVLELYGLKNSKKNIDYFILDKNGKYNEKELDLIYNSKYHFFFNDMKFMSFEQVYKMKKKDNNINDCKQMEIFLDNKQSKKIEYIKQTFLYTKVKFFASLISFLKKYNLYSSVRSCYRFIKGEK